MQRLTVPQRSELLLPLLAGLTVVLGSIAVGAVIGYRPALAPLIIGSPVAIVLAWVAFKAPGITFAAYLGIPFYKAATEPFVPIDLTLVLALVNIMQAVVFFLPGLKGHGSQAAHASLRRPLVIWFSLTLLILLGVLYSPDPPFAFQRTLFWIGLSAVPLLAVFRVVSEPRYIHQVLWTTFGIGAAVTVAGMILLPTIGAWPVDRLVVFGAHTIRVGQGALLVPLVALPYIWPTSRFPVRIAALALVPFALLVAASSGSRGPILFGAITLLLAGARALVTRSVARRSQRATIAPLRVALGVLVVGVLITFLQPGALVGLLPDTAVTRLSSLTDVVTGLAGEDPTATAPDESTAQRLIAYEGAVDMFNQSPVFGHGTSGFVEFAEAAGFDWDPEVSYPHNLFLQFAAEYGAIGLIVCAVILITSFRNLITRSRTSAAWNGILVLLIFFLLGAVVSSGIIDNRTLWGLVLLGLVAPTANNANAQGATKARRVAGWA